MACTVFQYKRDAKGDLYIDPMTRDLARREPFTVNVSEPISWRPEYGDNGL